MTALGSRSELEALGCLGDGASASTPVTWRWCVAYGSNASPLRLEDKGLDVDGAVLLPAELRDHVPAFEPRRTSYGSVPLTLVREPGAVTATWVLGLPEHLLDRLDVTEGRDPRDVDLDPRTAGNQDEVGTEAAVRTDDGLLVAPPGTYRLARVGTVRVAEVLEVEDAVAYVPGPATRAQVLDDGSWRTWPASDQQEAADHVDRGGPARSVPPPVDVVTGPWPANRLTVRASI